MFGKMVNCAESNNADIVICDYKTFNGAEEGVGVVHNQGLDNTWSAEKFRDEFLLDHYPNFLCNKIFKKKLFNGLVCPGNITFEDLYICAELFAKSFKNFYLEEPFYCYRIHASLLIRCKKYDVNMDCLLRGVNMKGFVKNINAPP